MISKDTIFIGSYHVFSYFDVVPMQACSLLLGCPWEYDTNALHHGRTNTYCLLHKGKKIVLLPLAPAEIVKQDKELAEISKNDNALDSSVATTKEIKLKGSFLIAKTSLNAENYVDGAPCRTMLTMFCRPVSPSRDHNTMSCNLCLAVTNLLLEFDGGMEWRMTPIQEGDDDEDITKVDTHEPCLSPS